MDIYKLHTPSFLVDLDILEKNIRDFQKLADENKKSLWPMIKTHKSTEIAKLQLKAGAEGFLTGNLDEAEILGNEGVENITYAYPIMGRENIKRAINISKKTNLYLSLDCIDQAKVLNYELEKEEKTIKVLIIIDSGLERFGVDPEKVGDFYQSLKSYNNIEVVGIATHPGQVYACKNMEEVEKVGRKEAAAIRLAKNKLKEAGLDLDIIASGSTPTFNMEARDKNINTLRPGNYVFFDNIQVSLGLVDEKDCALSILATIVSNPREDIFIIDAGSKCLGLDKGAHGNNSIKGYGRVVGHDELIISDLSEEVGKIKIVGKTELKIGDKIRIIPNHSCSSANLTSYLIGYRKKKFERYIGVDMRTGSLKRKKDS